ncbi:MAG: LCP family protein [Lachnospiraceae bacterium]|nr:LCP family protein [Lachnospiraceae bacterium]
MKKKIVLWVCIGIVALVLAVIAFLWFKGKHDLKRDTVSSSTTLVESMKDALEASSDEAKGTAQTGSSDASQEAGDPDLSDCIFYNGKYYRYNDDILTFLIMGIDQRSKEVKLQKSGFDAGSADALFLAVLNPHTQRLQIVGINRNTMADVEIYDEHFNYVETIKTQICIQHGFLDGGESSCKLTEKAVSKYMYDLPISGYCAVNMKAVGDINDAIGGVTLEILDDMTWYDPTLKKGETIHLSGKQAYVYTTRRKVNEWASADKRYARQRQYLKTFVKQAKEKIKENPSLVPTLYDEMQPYMTTDVSIDKAVYLSILASGFDFSGSDIIHFDGKIVLEDGFEAFYADEVARFQKTLDIFFEEVPTDDSN